MTRTLALGFVLIASAAWGQTPADKCAQALIEHSGGAPCVIPQFGPAQSDLDKALNICRLHSSETAYSITIPPQYAKGWEACRTIYEVESARRQRAAAEQEARDKAFVEAVAKGEKP